tara:strand:- start:745 stop:927 length:183 start_codon:yes stop_codon:yes gene_type:complete
MVDLNNEAGAPGYGMDEAMDVIRSSKHLVAIFFFCVLLAIIMSPTRIPPKRHNDKREHSE